MKMKDFPFFIYDEVQITPNIFSFNCCQKHMQSVQNSMGNSETLLYLLVNILVLHQSHKVIYHGIYKILLFDESHDHFLICEL